jgi:predicted CopG family antitoxin
MRQVKSFTISSDVLEEISSTKGDTSTSERVNELLRRALALERRERLEREAEAFFADENGASARERAAFQKESKQTLSRD